MSKRIKHVFATSTEVAHKWASRSQSDGRCRNAFFVGDTIYSYGRHYVLGQLIDIKKRGKKTITVALINNRSYSVITSGHQRDAHNAVRHLTSFSVPSVGNYPSDHIANIFHWVRSFKEAHDTALTKRHSKANVGEMRRCTGFMNEYIRVFGLKSVEKQVKEYEANNIHIPNKDGRWAVKYFRAMKNLTIPDQEDIDARVARQQISTDKRDAKRAAEWKAAEELHERRMAVIKEKGIPAWLRGENYFEHEGKDVNIGSYVHNFPTMLRVEGDEIRTSQGAGVPVVRCKKLWSYMKRAMERNEVMDKFNDSNKVGSYDFNSFDGNTLVIGCHTISIEEILRFTKQEGW